MSELDKRYLELALIADIELGPGERKRLLCPWCLGGQSGEHTLSLTKSEDGSIFWKCFRASCDASGRRDATELWVGTSRSDKAAPRPYTKPLEALVPRQKQFFRDTYELTFLEGIKYAPRDVRYSFPVISPLHKERGTVLRSFNGAVPKTLNFKTEVSEPFIGWSSDPTVYDGGPTVIVEDSLSALKVAQCGGMAVCLNGTHVSEEAAEEIGKYTRGRVIIALDNGTLKKMLTIKEKYGIILKYPRIWLLDLDIKYVPVEEIKEGLFDDRADFRAANPRRSNTRPRHIREIEESSN